MKHLTTDDWLQLQKMWDYLVIRDGLPDHADAIVVGGAALMTDMAQWAAELYHQRKSETIVVSGFKAKSASMIESEAVLLHKVLVANGVSEKNILVDSDASNTAENIVHSANLLNHYGASSEKIILVHKPFMARRFLATAQAQWPDRKPKQLFVTSIDMTLKDYFRMHHQAYPQDPERIIRAMLGEYERIKTYPSLGFFAEQTIPEEVEDGYRTLLSQGFEAR